jgi:hypothetical protein
LIRRIGDVASGPDVLDNRTVALLRPPAREQTIGDDAALQRFVLVMVRVDEARHDDCSGAVDDFGADREPQNWLMNHRSYDRTALLATR